MRLAVKLLQILLDSPQYNRSEYKLLLHFYRNLGITPPVFTLLLHSMHWLIISAGTFLWEHRSNLWNPHHVYFTGTSLRNLPLDGFTLSEVLRLHFLSSGAKATPGNVKFHYQQRGGYTPLDDAGLEFRQNEAAILKSLAHNSIYEMTVS